MRSYQKLLLGVALLLSPQLFGHGFARETLVHVDTTILPIRELFHTFHKNSFWVTCYDFTKQRCATQVVKSVGKSRTNCYVSISFDDDMQHDILCTPSQEFYRAGSEEWVSAVALRVGDELVGAQGIHSITALTFVKRSLKVYALEIENTHNFFVGTHAILTHNMVIPWAISATLATCTPVAWSLGQLGALIGAIPCAGGIAVGAVIGIIIKRMFVDDERAHYKLNFNTKKIEEVFNSTLLCEDKKEDANNDAQAPGKPTEKDGFVPKKNWDGKKVRHPRGWGWPDKKGNVWIPTGNGSTAHGGPHWDVQRPGRNRNYDNIFPSGKVK